jgi:hypothetical protein
MAPGRIRPAESTVNTQPSRIGSKFKKMAQQTREPMRTVKLHLESHDKVLTLRRRRAYAARFKSFCPAQGKPARVAGMEEDA